MWAWGPWAFCTRVVHVEQLELKQIQPEVSWGALGRGCSGGTAVAKAGCGRWWGFLGLSWCVLHWCHLGTAEAPLSMLLGVIWSWCGLGAQGSLKCQSS